MSKKKLDAFVETLEVDKKIECKVTVHYCRGNLKITVDAKK